MPRTGRLTEQGRQIEEARERAGLSRDGARERLGGISPATYRRWISGAGKQMLESKLQDILKKLASADGAPVNKPTRTPRVSAGLPKAVRVFIQREMLAYTEADVTDAEISEARGVFESPEARSFYLRGAPVAEQTGHLLKGLRNYARHVRATLRERGYVLDPEPQDEA